MRALVDQHQADLFYAMQLIFGDLGVEVYTPKGMEWFEQGYWNFGREHLGSALAHQYLTIDANYNLAGSCYETRDPAHPEMPIRCVTLDQFHDLGKWDYIVATVQDNQQGFHRLAQEVGAKYVLQVGNTRQQVDWSLDPLALVSSEVPIAGRGVLIHQPFDHETTFRYRDPSNLQKLHDPPGIASFVNLMPKLVDWPLWLGYQTYLPEFATSVYGIDGPDGNLHPVGRIADAMALSSFGLHLKPTGDGFGHVIHDWAAIGRPLIGKKSYYAGQMAERFWQDGVTCIDLEQRTPQDNADLIRAIWADKDRYRAMCEAIRAEFDRIDWAAEREAIRALLL